MGEPGHGEHGCGREQQIEGRLLKQAPILLIPDQGAGSERDPQKRAQPCLESYRRGFVAHCIDQLGHAGQIFSLTPEKGEDHRDQIADGDAADHRGGKPQVEGRKGCRRAEKTRPRGQDP